MTRQTAAAILAVLAMVGADATAAIRKGESYSDSYPTRYLVEERSQPSEEVVPGKWHSHLEKCRAYAEANGLPLIAVWSNGDKCGHCKKFENNALSDVFEAWMATSGIVYYFGYYEDSNSSDATVRQKGGMGGEWGYWCGGKSTDKALPFVRIYWKDSSGNLRIDYDTNGDTWDGYNGLGTDNTYNVGGQYMIDFLMNSTNGRLKDYSPAPTYAGGEFAVHTDQTVGLQAELGKTTTVYVPFSRESASAQKKAYTNKLRITYPDNAATEVVKDIEWVEGAASATVAVEVSNYLTGVQVGERIALRLLDSEGKQQEKRYITYVSPVGNSPKNPYWGNERTAETLQFGEWTMNLDAVKGKVKAFNSKKSAERAYAMVLVGGSLWCPDCVMADHWLYDYEVDGVNQFEKWAKANNVALGVVDIPNYTAAGATSGSCLLTYDVNTTSDNYASGRGTFEKDESELVQSGAQYLSRHGITPDEAAAAMKTNKKLVQRDTTAGGFRRPESSNAYRPGVPVMLLLRNDGDNWSVAGRLDTFSSNAPRSYSANYLTRLEELLAQIDEAAEESNDDWRTTTERIAKRGVAEGRTLSHTDLKDVYIIEPDAVGQMLDFKLTGKSTSEVTLSVISSVNDKLTLASATGSPASGTVSITCKIPSDKCFLVVSTKRGDAAQAGSSVVDYSLSSDNVLVASEATQYETVTDGNPVVTISTEAGKTYRISNVDESKLGGYFTKAASAGFYVASTTGSAKVYLKDSTVEGGKVVYKTDYQVWKTGVVGFDRGVATTKEIENDFDYTLKVTRTGGVSGVAKASISLDASEALDDGSVFVWSSEGTVFEWADGEDDVKTVSVKIRANTYADGEQRLTFRLTQVAGESDAGVDEVLGVLTLVIKDDDAATAGTLAICGSEPGFSKQMTTVAAAGSKVKIKVSRENGADGEATAVLKTSAGLFSNDKDTFELGWASRSNDVKTVTLTLPEKASGVTSLQVTLSSTSSATVDNARKYLAVKTSECNAAFEAESTAVELQAVRYVPFSTELYVNESTLGEGTVAVRKLSGSLAPGLSWNYDNGTKTVYVAGTPAQAGSWTVVYQVTENGAAGLTASLTVDVSELAVSEDDEVEPPINASVAETRTVKDIIVMDSDRFVGLLTVTIPQSGRLSAKMRLAAGGYVSFLSEGWNRLEGRDLVAELRDIEGGAETVSVRAAADGGLTVATSLGDTCVVPAVQWSSATPASAWQGYYTVSMPQTSVVDVDSLKANPLTSGAGYATLKMSATSAASGKMAYAGVLPNGRAFSGVGVLTPDVDSWNSDRGAYDYVFLPVISETDGDRFFGVFKVLTGGAHLPCRSVFATPSFTWVRDGDREELVRTTAMDAFGSGYDGDDDIAQACSDTFQEELDLLKFYALTDELYDHLGFTRGAALPWDTTYTSVKVWSASGATKIKIKPYAEEAKVRNGLVFSYNRASGIVSGTLRIDFENGSSANALFRGVVMPRWGASCAMCSFGSDLTLRPFISGSVWFTDTYEYTTAKGRPATKDVKRGCSFSVGVNPGE